MKILVVDVEPNVVEVVNLCFGLHWPEAKVVAAASGEVFDSGDRSGLGLGLVIAKSLVELYNGRIWIGSSGHAASVFFSVAVPSRRTVSARSLDPIAASNWRSVG